MKQNILIIDDDKDICVTLSKILSSKGFETIISNNSDTAINEIKNKPVDLVLLDVWLEGSKKNGLELLKIIKSFNPNTPVILISGHANVEMAVKAIKEGAFYFIEKPFKSEKLFLIIDRALENAFLRNKYEVLLETSGAISLNEVPNEVKKIVDFKCPSSDMSDKNLWSIIDELNTEDEIKFVIGDRDDYDWTKEKIAKYNLNKQWTILISPVFDKMTLDKLAKWILEDNLDVRLQLQMHKYIWDPEMRAV